LALSAPSTVTHSTTIRRSELFHFLNLTWIITDKIIKQKCTKLYVSDDSIAIVLPFADISRNQNNFSSHTSITYRCHFFLVFT
jgi:hypothetical protein